MIITYAFGEFYQQIKLDGEFLTELPNPEWSVATNNAMKNNRRQHNFSSPHSPNIVENH
jgi:hypothetical protein